jgi:hypothetical protein
MSYGLSAFPFELLTLPSFLLSAEHPCPSQALNAGCLFSKLLLLALSFELFFSKLHPPTPNICFSPRRTPFHQIPYSSPPTPSCFPISLELSAKAFYFSP